MNIIFSSVIGSEFTLMSTAVIFFTSLLTGFILSEVYMYTNKESGYNSHISEAIIMFPFVIGAVLMVSSVNYTGAVVLAFAIGVCIFKMNGITQKDIIYIFSSLASGIICGMGYVACAAYYMVIFCICMIVIEKLKICSVKKEVSVLTISVPEMEDYSDAFDDIFKKYLSYCKIISVKNSCQYAQYNVEYLIQVKKGVCEKSFIDAIKARNGNLEVILLKDVECKNAA